VNRLKLHFAKHECGWLMNWFVLISAGTSGTTDNVLRMQTWLLSLSAPVIPAVAKEISVWTVGPRRSVNCINCAD